jgi:putative DNA primase/helicase
VNALTDFNDLSAFEGLEAVADIVNHATPATEPPTWPEPIMPGTLRTPPIPADVLPTWMCNMVTAVAASTQTPPALAVMSCLAMLATVLQRRFEVAPHGGDSTVSTRPPHLDLAEIIR